MAKRQGRFDPRELEADVRFQDESEDLWNQELSGVARGLLTSAVRCFAFNGYHATTTREIAAGMGLSPAALYVHFVSKELVLYEIIRSGHERALELVDGPSIQGVADPTDRLKLLVRRYTAWHARHHVAARVAQYELAGLTEEHYAEILRLRHLTNQVFRRAVARVLTDRDTAPVDVNRVVRAILSLSIDLVRWYRLNGPDSPEELGEFYADLVLRMLLQPQPEQRLPDEQPRPGAAVAPVAARRRR
ncbi:TetR/AcrR family transcriptional regulator [Acidiferrimicrobium sp. IK]|uniref:TetR/AcrR family transcriptional regulator n=1 Tax=Acidiferrimicrobium sp. IK TaxID=2871700 RepID=UPI0021CB91AC|nr:TetR/AcrR family transcriptional regulator [Acidiferrimicrobium sp. IK]MCU4186670.1 TetR/AcrR family transcriptional regulator [Acidiferrimicrobium sp. IK]